MEQISVNAPKLDVDHLFAANAVETKADLLMLTRSLVGVPRSHTLPMASRESILEHCARAVQLTDFLHANDLIQPALNETELRDIKNYMMYHDVHESIIGDVPYFVEKSLGNAPSTVRDKIIKHFGVNIQLSPELFQLAKIIDAFEFYLTVSFDAHIDQQNFAGKRLQKVQENAAAIIDKYLENALKYKIDIEKFDDLVNKSL